MDEAVKKDAIKRLSIIQGHLQKVKEMVEEGNYCPDVIHQSLAIQAALKKTDEIILHGHLHSCVLGDLHGSKAKNEELIDEILDLFRKQN